MSNVSLYEGSLEWSFSVTFLCNHCGYPFPQHLKTLLKPKGPLIVNLFKHGKRQLLTSDKISVSYLDCSLTIDEYFDQKHIVWLSRLKLFFTRRTRVWHFRILLMVQLFYQHVQLKQHM